MLEVRQAFGSPQRPEDFMEFETILFERREQVAHVTLNRSDKLNALNLQMIAPKLGLMPDLGSTFFLPRLVGTARAKGMAMLGDALSAADAERWGLIWASVEDQALSQQAAAVARRLAAGPTQSFRRIKAI